MKLDITTNEVSLLIRLLSTAMEDEGVSAAYTRALNRLQQKCMDVTAVASAKQKELRQAASVLEQLAEKQTRSFDKKMLTEAAEALDAAADLEGAC